MTVERRAASSYCTQVGIERPRLEDVIATRQMSLFQTMIVALLERGRPMMLDEIANRLDTAGVPTPRVGFAEALVKAWHGLKPIHRAPDGAFALDVTARALDYQLSVLGLRPRSPDLLPPPAPLVMPGDDVPLGVDELDAAFRDRLLSNVSLLRQAGAVLDAHGPEMTLGEVDAVLSDLCGRQSSVVAASAEHWRSPLVTLLDDSRILVNRDTAEARAMRRAVRALAKATFEARARNAWHERVFAIVDARYAAQGRQDAIVAASSKRAVLSAGRDGTVALVDPGTRAVELVRDGASAARALVAARLDIIAAIDVRRLLHGLGLDPDAWRVVDLAPPQKSYRLNRSGRTLRITPDLLIAGTNGARPPRRPDAYVKALCAFYEYGVLHGYVRLRWGFLDETLGVEWALPGDMQLHDIANEAIERRAPVDIVTGEAPGWSDPWVRARRVDVIGWDHPWLVVRDDGAPRHVDPREIQFIRIAPANAGLVA